MAGRKRMPDSVKKNRGTLRAGRVNPDAPDPDDAAPVAPPWLAADELINFNTLLARITPMGVASSTDTEALSLAAKRLTEIQRLDAIIEMEGPVIDSVNTRGERMLRGNPAVAQRSEAMRHLQTLLSEFGLTPAARSKVSAKKADKPSGAFQKRKT